MSGTGREGTCRVPYVDFEKLSLQSRAYRRRASPGTYWVVAWGVPEYLVPCGLFVWVPKFNCGYCGTIHLFLRAPLQTFSLGGALGLRPWQNTPGYPSGPKTTRTPALVGGGLRTNLTRETNEQNKRSCKLSCAAQFQVLEKISFTLQFH